MCCQAWRSKLVILVLRGQRKEDYEFEAGLIGKAKTLTQGEEGEEGEERGRGEGEGEDRANRKGVTFQLRPQRQEGTKCKKI